VSKQMTWAELVAWAERNGARVVTHFRPVGSGHGWWADVVWTEEIGGRRVRWGIGAAGPYDSEGLAKRALCRAVAAIREAK